MIECVVRFQQVGYHRWSDAPEHRSYLADRHRHNFHIEVSVQQLHGNREIEYHDLLDYCRGALFAAHEYEDLSCEQMAEWAVQSITRRWSGRRVVVSIFEDGECGARVTYSPDLI